MSSASLIVTFPSVMVPVLSEQRMFILPKFSMDDNRFTMTFFLAIALAPVAKLTVIIAGSNWGVSPTASASENKNDSSAGLCKTTLMANMMITSISVISI